jgi:DNA-directed RNA polymerase subunit M/transcription elongation factor TFIIS
MKFCDICGSYMDINVDVYECHKCGKTEQLHELEIKRMKDSTPKNVYVIYESERNYPKVNRICPQCGNNEAYRNVFTTSGEHAGVKQERTVENYKCTRCFHSWTRS